MDKINIKILQVDISDLIGRAFNGHDLQISLNEQGYSSYQAVKYKFGTEDTTIKIGSCENEYINSYIRNLEKETSMNNLLGEWDRKLELSEHFQMADIVHYHKIHAGIIPLRSFPRLTKKKPSVWTIHDPWAITGHCVHPLDCDMWKSGCKECSRLTDYYFPLKQDKASQLWNIKKYVYADLDIDIVVSSEFMMKYLIDSPLTNQIKHIHRIPFGIKLEYFNKFSKHESRKFWNISSKDIVIGFRNDSNIIKGCKYIYDALLRINDNRIVLLSIGEVGLPQEIKNSYRSIELGWQNDNIIINKFYSACDIFLMPSLAESFGLMAIEAMASKCTVIVFKDTVLEDLVFSPECGIAVDYKSSKAIGKAIMKLIQNPLECKIRGERGFELVEQKYSYGDYVRRHIELYEDIIKRKSLTKEG